MDVWEVSWNLKGFTESLLFDNPAAAREFQDIKDQQLSGIGEATRLTCRPVFTDVPAGYGKSKEEEGQAWPHLTK